MSLNKSWQHWSSKETLNSTPSVWSIKQTKKNQELDIKIHACNPRTFEAEN